MGDLPRLLATMLLSIGSLHGNSSFGSGGDRRRRIVPAWPSPTALAVRLDGLQARDLAALDALTEQLPDPPWDVEVNADDTELLGLLRARGFAEYARGAIYARPVAGVSAPRVAGIEVVAYENRWAPAFIAAEAEAMQGLAASRSSGAHWDTNGGPGRAVSGSPGPPKGA